MYCTRCGKQIDYDAPLCLECTAEIAAEAKTKQESAQPEVKATPVAEPVVNPAPQPAPQPTPQPQAKPDTSKEGLGKAISSLILGLCVPVLGGVALGLMLSELVGGGVFFALVAAALGIVSILNGVASIKTFKNVVGQGNRAPIATLILGISGIVFAGLSLMICFVYGLLLAAIM